VEFALEEIVWVETVGAISFFLISWCNLDTRCSSSVAGIWSVIGEGSLLFCYVLGKESVWFRLMGAFAPDLSGVGSGPRLTTSVVGPC
jgi:hypothetical protein